MLCKAENRDPAHCLKEGRRVTRCAQDLYVSLTTYLPLHLPQSRCCSFAYFHTARSWETDIPYRRLLPMNRITKLRENCLSEFEKHWSCLEYNNQACSLHSMCLPLR